MNLFDFIFLGFGLVGFSYGITIVVLTLRRRRRDENIEEGNEQVLLRTRADIEKIGQAGGKLASNLIDFFLVYQRWRSTKAKSQERIDARLELLSLWEKLPHDAKKRLNNSAAAADLS